VGDQKIRRPQVPSAFGACHQQHVDVQTAMAEVTVSSWPPAGSAHKVEPSGGAGSGEAWEAQLRSCSFGFWARLEPSRAIRS
jgi:hypothetical protein